MQNIDIVFDDQTILRIGVSPDTTVEDVIKYLIEKSEEGYIQMPSKCIKSDDICLTYNNQILSSNEKLYSKDYNTQTMKKYCCFINPTLYQQITTQEEDSELLLSMRFKLDQACTNYKGELVKKQNRTCKQAKPIIIIILLIYVFYLCCIH